MMPEPKKKIVAAVLVTALLVTGMPELFVNEVSAEEMMWRGEGEMLTVETPTVEKPSPSPSQGRLENPRTDSDGVVTWDCVCFGNYWQEDTNGDGKADKSDGKQPIKIKWRVLSVDGEYAFLLADKNLDAREYNDVNTEVT